MATVRDVGNLVGTAHIVMLFQKAKGKPVPASEFSEQVEKIGEAVRRENNLESALKIADLPSDTLLGVESEGLYKELDVWWEQVRP